MLLEQSIAELLNLITENFDLDGHTRMIAIEEISVAPRLIVLKMFTLFKNVVLKDQAALLKVFLILLHVQYILQFGN